MEFIEEKKYYFSSYKKNIKNFIFNFLIKWIMIIIRTFLIGIIDNYWYVENTIST